MSPAATTPTATPGLRVGCAGCPVAGPRCGDCLVSFVDARSGDDAVIFDVAEERALRCLAKAGMLGEVVAREPLCEAGPSTSPHPARIA